MEEILIVSSTQKGRILLEELLGSHHFDHIITAESGSKARRMILENRFDLVVINSPLSDEFGHELALMVAESSNAGILMMVKSELADEVSAKVEDYGVFVVPKPVSKQLFFQSLKLIEASCKRIQGLKKENIRLQQKIEEISLMDRAKCALVQYLGLNEAQAHRYIEKQAMDRRITKREVSVDILKTYEK